MAPKFGTSGALCVGQDLRPSSPRIFGDIIPADRNGLKFYARSGEITKEDGLAISAASTAARTARWPGGASGSTPIQPSAATT